MIKVSKLFGRSSLKITKTKTTITLVKEKRIISISKEKDQKLFEEVEKLSKTRAGIKEIEKNFEEYFKKNLDFISEQDMVEHSSDYTGRVKLKGTNNTVPQDILKKFRELEGNSQEKFLALLKFWYKLDRNPSKNSREQLHRFLMHNNVPITENGDIILEKGVRINEDGKLVDCYTGKFDNSIGRIVEMNRDDVVDNPNQTCSAGLHAAPPDYVRKWYGDEENVLLKILVSPEDIVSVPVDYNSQKIRCCKYQVIGYSDKNSSPLTGDKVIRLEDLLSDLKVIPQDIQFKKTKILEDSNKSTKEAFQIDVEFESMTAKQIIDYILTNFGVEITLNIKNKKGIVKKAYEIASSEAVKKNYMEPEEVEVEVKEIQLPSTNQELIQMCKDKFNENINSRVNGKKPNKPLLEQRFIELFEGAGFTVIRPE